MAQYLITATRRLRLLGSVALMLPFFSLWADTLATASAPAVATANPAVNPPRFADDFYQAVNYSWLQHSQIPADKAAWGTFYELRQANLDKESAIIQDLSRTPSDELTVNQRLLIALYQSYMEQAAINQQALTPLQPLLTQVSQLTKRTELAAIFGQLGQQGITTPLAVSIHPDQYNSSLMRADYEQSGLGLPDRDYYLVDTPEFKRTLVAYQAYISQLLRLAGVAKPESAAIAIINLERKLAKLHWSNEDNRDPTKTYHLYPMAQLASIAPGFAFASFNHSFGLPTQLAAVIVSQPSYLTGLAQLMRTIPLATWQNYLRFCILNSYASYLPHEYESAHFAFYGTVLSGRKQISPRSERALGVIDNYLGEAMGQEYVAHYFAPESKARILELIGNLKHAYGNSITHLTWMSEATKARAREKLDKMMVKVAYPDKWQNYPGLTLSNDRLIDNILKLTNYLTKREVAKLLKPVDRSLWEMDPQTVNAYYNPQLNEIVFPAAILVPPFFDPAASNARNYGAIGAVIGHEISHAFDDQGSKFDANGSLKQWFTVADHARFSQLTSSLVEQYNQYQPLPGYHVNGKLTLGENIADISGLAIAYDAFNLTLSPTLSPEQKTAQTREFYHSYATIWRSKVRPEAQLMRLKTDPHSPGEVRTNAVVKNQATFYSAFEVESSDKMYLAPQQRVKIW
jgi:predicted metalloendopeptidase